MRIRLLASWRPQKSAALAAEKVVQSAKAAEKIRKEMGLFEAALAAQEDVERAEEEAQRVVQDMRLEAKLGGAIDAANLTPELLLKRWDPRKRGAPAPAANASCAGEGVLCAGCGGVEVVMDYTLRAVARVWDPHTSTEVRWKLDGSVRSTHLDGSCWRSQKYRGRVRPYSVRMRRCDVLLFIERSRPSIMATCASRTGVITRMEFRQRVREALPEAHFKQLDELFDAYDVKKMGVLEPDCMKVALKSMQVRALAVLRTDAPTALPLHSYCSSPR